MTTEVKKCVVIGTSAGGVDALKIILPCFKRPSPLAVVIVIHLPPSGPNLIPSLFEGICDFNIKEAESGEALQAETIYIAAPDYHLSVESNHTLSLSTELPVNFSRPAIDILFESAAYAFKENVLGILLTGANSDGAKGLFQIHKEGGKTVIQNPATADYPVMPQSPLEYFRPDFTVDLKDIEKFIANYQLEIV